jgi:hypothetical protein
MSDKTGRSGWRAKANSFTKPLARILAALKKREASWSAPALWRFQKPGLLQKPRDF